MISIKLSDKNFFDAGASCYVMIVEQDFKFDKDFKELAKRFFPQLEALMREQGFTGKQQTIFTLPIALEKRVATLMIVGIGKRDSKKNIAIERYRRVLGTAVRRLPTIKAESCVLQVPEASGFGVSQEYLARETVLTLNMAAYHFGDFITDPERKPKLDMVTLAVQKSVLKDFKKGVGLGECMAKGVNKARHWIDMPPLMTTPAFLADRAREIGKEHNLKVTVFDEKTINKMGMGGLAAVSRGSELDCQFVVMEYKTTKKNAPTVAFVGKGITFDSGGLSIKPASNMETMKEDMSGAAAVITSMEILAQLKPAINIIGLAPIAENLPSGTATRPGDIIRFYNGKTAEVKNTDAEGRLILADALSYAVKHYKPDAIIDLATLTGACAYALGPFFSGMFSQHDELVKRVQEAADSSGDRVWRLPFDSDYKPAVSAEVADLCNSGNRRYMAGATTAAFFLQAFVDETPWVHLDIAGTAFDVPDIPYFRPGGTGVGVRLLVDLAMNWK